MAANLGRNKSGRGIYGTKGWANGSHLRAGAPVVHGVRTTHTQRHSQLKDGEEFSIIRVKPELDDVSIKEQAVRQQSSQSVGDKALSRTNISLSLSSLSLPVSSLSLLSLPPLSSSLPPSLLSLSPSLPLPISKFLNGQNTARWGHRHRSERAAISGCGGI